MVYSFLSGRVIIRGTYYLGPLVLGDTSPWFAVEKAATKGP